MKVNIPKPDILIACNDENGVSLFHDVLEEYNYAVTIVNSLSKIYDFYKHKKYDVVILTNLGLLPNEIIDCVIRMRKLDPEINLLVLSGADDSMFIKTLADFGLETFYGLPIDFEELNSRIQFLLTNKLMIAPKEKEVLYRAEVVGSLIEIDENGNRNDIYILPTAPGTQYKVGDYLFHYTKLNSGEEFHTAEQELSLLNEDDFNFEKKSIEMDKKKDTKKYAFNLYGNKDSKNLKELIVKYTRERIKEIEPHFNEAIIKWENNLYKKAIDMDMSIFQSWFWFEKVFSFIYLEGGTKYIEIAKLFSMPRKLYERFEKIYKYYEGGLLKKFNL